MSQRIVLLHATPVAMVPVHQAFKELWPEAELVNLLDDGLTIDRAKDTELTASLCERFVNFGRYAYHSGADAILATCSAFGPAIKQMAETLPVPVLKPNEAMFSEALRLGKRIGMLATFAPSVVTMEAEFAEFAQQQQSEATLKTLVVEGAIEQLRQGNAQQHNRLVAERAPELEDCDVIMLAHFSTSGALQAVSETVRNRVLTAPHSAVTALKQRMT